MDDEPLALEKIKLFAGRLPQLILEATFGNGTDALQYLTNHKIDIVFLDIQMEKLNGIELLEKLDIKPQVILITASANYALKGFELSVTDYILKPYNFDRFAASVHKASEYLQWQQRATLQVKTEAEYVFVKSGYKLVKIMLNDILYIEGMRDFQSILCKSGRIMASHSMQELENMLSHTFVRCHKSFIVSIPKIESIERERIFIGSKSIPIGEMYRNEFYKHL